MNGGRPARGYFYRAELLVLRGGEELQALDEDLNQMRADTIADLREHDIDPDEYAVGLDRD